MYKCCDFIIFIINANESLLADDVFGREREREGEREEREREMKLEMVESNVSDSNTSS